MTRYVAFLRAINVGGHVVKMDRLRKIFDTLGVSNVATFIASGNVLFESGQSPDVLEAAIEKTLRRELGYDVATMVRRLEEVEAVVSHVKKQGIMPGEGVMLYIGFLKSAPTASAAKAVAALSNHVDVLAVHRRELYWHCRKSFSESTVTGGKLERLLAVPATVRNFTTVQKLAARAHP
jgi:uncharacterized protein (DUF1697 family)